MPVISKVIENIELDSVYFAQWVGVLKDVQIGNTKIVRINKHSFVRIFTFKVYNLGMKNFRAQKWTYEENQNRKKSAHRVNLEIIEGAAPNPLNIQILT